MVRFDNDNRIAIIKMVYSAIFRVCLNFSKKHFHEISDEILKELFSAMFQPFRSNVIYTDIT